MSQFYPELREDLESFFEAKKFSPKLEQKLIDALDAQKEIFADIIKCPNQSCGIPLTVTLKTDYAEVHCSGCGWNRIVKRHNTP